MDKNIEELLKEVVKDLRAPKNAQVSNVLDNPFYRTLIEGALKSLENSCSGVFDWKLTAIVKLLQTWYKDRAEEVGKRKPEQMFNFEQINYPQPATYSGNEWFGSGF